MFDLVNKISCSSLPLNSNALHVNMHFTQNTRFVSKHSHISEPNVDIGRACKGMSQFYHESFNYACDKTRIMAQRSNDSDEELQEAHTKRPRLHCGYNSVNKKFGGASTYKSKFQKSFFNRLLKGQLWNTTKHIML